jgi:hypothetical protein
MKASITRQIQRVAKNPVKKQRDTLGGLPKLSTGMRPLQMKKLGAK